MMKTILKKIFPREVINFYHLVQSVCANIVYGFPSRKLVVIGVTGTDGKTTTSNFITQVLDGSGHSCGLLSTALFKVGDTMTVNETKMTTIGPFKTQKMLKDMVESGNTHVVVETSSHAIDQYRTWGIAYDIAVMTNLSREHLDYHKTMDHYKETKKKLFCSLKNAFRKKNRSKVMILNKEDETFQEYASCHADLTIAYGLNSGDVFVKDVQYQLGKTICRIRIPQRDITIHVPMPGEMNVYNMLAAIGVAVSLDIDAGVIEESSKVMKPVPGRMQSIHVSEFQKFSVFIDYAVTPKAFAQLYETLKQIPHRKTIAVFGACGDRDKGKRPTLGEIALSQTDYIILTNEDNWSEDPMDIISQIEKGILNAGGKKGIDYEIIVDREEAIKKAISIAEENDIVMVTGKGNETGMALSKTEVISWSDQEVIEKHIKQRYGTFSVDS